MNKKLSARKLLILSQFIFICFSSFSQTKYSIGFRLLNRIPGEHYVIRVNTPPESQLLGEPIFLDIDTTGIAYTGAIYPTGISIFFIQESGPRTCYFNGHNYGTVVINNANAIVDLDCTTPGPATNDRRIILSTSQPGPGETFDFIVEKAGRRITNLTITQNNYQNVITAKLFARGDTLRLSQTMGPRLCNPAGTYIIPDTGDLRINLNCGTPPPPKDRAVIVSTSRPGPGESFEFIIEKDERRITTLTVTENNYQNVATGKLFARKDALRFTQSIGPRVCNAARTYIIPDTGDLRINLNCGTPPPLKDRAIILSTTKPEPGESFEFIIEKDERRITTLTVTENNYQNVTTGKLFARKDTLRFTQSIGPRVCNAARTYIIPETGDLRIDLYCGRPASQSLSRLAGTFSAAPGARVVIRSGANEELILTADANGVKGFRFPKEYQAGDTYSLSIKTAPSNCNCTIFPSSSGIMPTDSMELRIVCNTGVELVSRSTDNKITNTFYETSAPVVGGKGADEGRYVAFVSNGTGLDGATGKYRQIFWRDMRSGITKMISRAADGTEGDKDSFFPSISADGKSVAFESYATNLGSGDNNGVRDVYVWKEGGGIRWVSAGGNAESYEPMISGDGSAIVFSSSASTLANGVDGTSIANVFLSKGGSSQLISKDSKTGKALGGSAPHISEDGNKLVFCSFSDKLVSNDKNVLWDIFLWQNGNPQLRKLSNTSVGGDRDQGTESASRVVSASISGNGNYIVYATTATNMVGYDNNKMQDIFICDISGGGVRRLSVTANNTEGDGDSPIDQGGRIGISYDGKWITYNTNASNLGVAKGNIILQNTQTGKIIPVTNSIYNTSGRPMLSRDGNFVVAGCSEKLDKRFVSSGIFWFFAGAK